MVRMQGPRRAVQALDQKGLHTNVLRNRHGTTEYVSFGFPKKNHVTEEWFRSGTIRRKCPAWS
jgi:hypothetical protein